MTIHCSKSTHETNSSSNDFYIPHPHIRIHDLFTLNAIVCTLLFVILLTSISYILRLPSDADSRSNRIVLHRSMWWCFWYASSSRSDSDLCLSLDIDTQLYCVNIQMILKRHSDRSPIYATSASTITKFESLHHWTTSIAGWILENFKSMGREGHSYICIEPIGNDLCCPVIVFDEILRP